MIKKILKTCLSLMVLAIFITTPQTGHSQNQPPSPEAIADFLNQHPLISPTDGRVLQVYYQGEALVINLSQAVLPNGTYDEALFTQLQQDLDLAFNINAHFMTTFKVEGLVLEAWGKPEPDFGLPPQIFSFRSPREDAPLSGISVALSPGHGLFWSEYWGQWAYQRGEFYGIREDLVNAEIMRYVTAALLNQGATVISLREMDPNARTGVTGYPAWHEAARQYLIYEGAPSWVWNSSDINYNRDIRARPYAANYYGADILISLHNNGWNGTLTGTETYYDTDNHPGSPGLAAAVHNRIINMIRSEYDPDWYNRGIKPSDSNYGEINYAQMPAILIELAFMDTQFPDNAYLQDEAFKQLAARAITFGICDFLGVICTDTPILLPIIQETPVLNPLYGSGPCDSGWYSHPNQRGQNAYLALNVSDLNESQHFALWQPNLPMSGVYRVEAFIPNHGAIDWGCPDLTLTSDTLHAGYQITHAQGTSMAIANQGPVADDWVDLGTHYFNAGEDGFIILTDVTGEADQTAMISASAMRFTLVGNAMTPLYNRDWITEDGLTQDLDTTVDEIREFLAWQNSCLFEPIVDADGLVMDIPSLIYQSSVNRSINPQVLLAVMEKEQNAITQCPDTDALANLMGLDPPNTARQQIDNAALLLRQALDMLNGTGATPNGWSTGVTKTTVDGVGITSANDTITVLLDFEPYAGEGWGGSLPGENGLHGIYAAWEWFGFEAPLRSLQPKVLFFPIIWNE